MEFLVKVGLLEVRVYEYSPTVERLPAFVAYHGRR
jgi:hypothetical protein